MVVDDDIVTRKLVSRWLKSQNYKVEPFFPKFQKQIVFIFRNSQIVVCKTSFEAWKGIQEWTKETKGKEAITRMILSDVTMPEISGFKLLEWVMSDKTTKHIPVIL